MAREIVTWCDPCMGRDERTPGQEETITLGSQRKPRVLALCPPHRDEYVKPLEALLEEFGAPADGAQPARRVAAGSPGPQKTLLDFTQSGTRKGRVPEGGDRGAICLWCPLTYAGDGSGLIRHLESAHGLPRSIKEVFGNGPCPRCGKGVQLLGAHQAKTHPELGHSVTAAYRWARDNGDPYGRYAEVLAKAKVLG